MSVFLTLCFLSWCRIKCTRSSYVSITRLKVFLYKILILLYLDTYMVLRSVLNYQKVIGVREGNIEGEGNPEV